MSASIQQIQIARNEKMSILLIGVQVSKLLQTNFTILARYVLMWSNSVSVLQCPSVPSSQTCKSKIFEEIQTFTDVGRWQYSQINPAGDITGHTHEEDDPTIPLFGLNQTSIGQPSQQLRHRGCVHCPEFDKFCT